MMPGNGEVRVPPGFRFHPTEEELLYYYLRKKVAYEAIDLDVIRDIDLNKLEPWDLKEKCRIGSGPQNEWYFFSHKDKKYPTGTRTNRATAAGFWKATGRDKTIHHSNSKRIGMRKTLVFYTGRAPHGQKTDWIMHEYRLQEDNYSELQEDGWVVCRVFMKKSHQKGHQSEIEEQFNHFNASGSGAPLDGSKHKFHDVQSEFSVDHSMHLPQLLSPELGVAPFLQPAVCMNNNVEVEYSQNMMNKLGGGGGGGGGGSNNNIHHHQERPYNGDWSFLDKLLASHQSLDHHLISCHVKSNNPVSQALEIGSLVQRFPFQYAACESEFMKCSK